MSEAKMQWQLSQKEGACSYPLSQSGLIFIGCEECDIILQSPGVEKRHAVLSFNAEKQDFYIKDLNSMTGTYINDVRIPEQSYFKLNHNDQIRFGYGAYFTLNKDSPEPQSSKKEQGDQSFSTVEESQNILEADSLEDLKEDPSQQQHLKQTEGQGHHPEATLQERKDDLTLPLGTSSSHKISPLSTQVIINYSVVAQSPDRKSDMSTKTNGSADSSDSSAGTMTLTAGQQQQQPASMAFTIPFDGDISSKTFTRKKPRSKEEKTRHQTSDSERGGSRGFRPIQKSSSDDHSSETEHYTKANGLDKKAPDKGTASPHNTPSEVTCQAPISDTTSYLIQRMLDGSQSAKWAGGKNPEPIPTATRWAVKKTPEQDIAPQVSSPSHHTRWGSTGSGKTPEGEPLFTPAQAKWASRKTPEEDPQSKWASRKTPETSRKTPEEDQQSKWSSRRTPEQEYTARWGSRKTPDQEPPAPSKWAIMSSPTRAKSPTEKQPVKEKDVDDKSETGTYTVDIEDPVVEEARSKIDEVFGVTNSMQGSVFKKTEQVEPVGNGHDNDARLSTRDINQAKHPAFTTPPAEKTTFDFIPFNHVMTSSTPNLYGNTYRNRKDAFQHENHAQTPPPRPPPRTMRSSKPETRPQENGRGSMGRSLSNNETGDSLSDGSPQASKHAFYGVAPWRRKSWNISCSDLELDQGKVETSSVLSDLSTSTEPSSHSSHSSRSRSGEVGPQMRLNRAFALRRARLGFESDEPVRSPQVGVQAVRPLPRGASVSQGNLSRQDGGRFSLRLPRSAVVKMNKPPGKPREIKNVVQPYQHQPMENKSYVPIPVRKENVPPSPEVELAHHGSTRSKREVSALDSLVISAIQQLSVKLKGNACQLLERERQKYPETSDTRMMIEEILPQMMEKRSSESASEGNLTRDLSSILKNLKRIEQTLDVFAVLREQHPIPAALPASPAPPSSDQPRSKAAGKRGFFVVDV